MQEWLSASSLGELFEKKLLPGVKNSVKFEYQHYILSFYCFMLALCTFLTKKKSHNCMIKIVNG